jgi:hypothetical protein
MWSIYFCKGVAVWEPIESDDEDEKDTNSSNNNGQGNTLYRSASDSNKVRRRNKIPKWTAEQIDVRILHNMIIMSKLLLPLYVLYRNLKKKYDTLN